LKNNLFSVKKNEVTQYAETKYKKKLKFDNNFKIGFVVLSNVLNLTEMPVLKRQMLQKQQDYCE